MQMSNSKKKEAKLLTPKINTVIFDVDDTLYDQRFTFKQALVESFSYDFTESTIDQIYLLSRKYSDDVFADEQSGKITSEDLQVYRMTEAMKDVGFDISKADALQFQQTYLFYQHRITLIPEIKQLLDFLTNKDITLAILTNGIKDHQQMKINQLKVDQWIPSTHQYISGALPYQKPDRRVFDFVIDDLSLDRSSTYYVGDAYINDVLGAKSADLSVVWFNHRYREPEGDIKPDFTVTSGAALLDLFKQVLD